MNLTIPVFHVPRKGQGFSTTIKAAKQSIKRFKGLKVLIKSTIALRQGRTFWYSGERLQILSTQISVGQGGGCPLAPVPVRLFPVDASTPSRSIQGPPDCHPFRLGRRAQELGALGCFARRIRKHHVPGRVFQLAREKFLGRGGLEQLGPGLAQLGTAQIRQIVLEVPVKSRPDSGYEAPRAPAHEPGDILLILLSIIELDPNPLWPEVGLCLSLIHI